MPPARGFHQGASKEMSGATTPEIFPLKWLGQAQHERVQAPYLIRERAAPCAIANTRCERL